MDKIEAALESEYISGVYEWDAEANDWWYRYRPPSPALFAFYAQLLSGSTYRAVSTFRNPIPDWLQAEFVADEIVIYERIDER